jgi:6-phosphogluconolactonase
MRSIACNFTAGFAAVITFMSVLQMLGAEQSSSQTEYFVYVGTYGKGVYAYRFHADGAKLEELGMVGPVTNPSFVATDRGYKYLYAVSELEGKENGGVASFAIDREKGTLKPLNNVPSAGVAPCHLAIDRTGKMLMVANYGTGGVSSFAIENDGRIGTMASLMTAQGSSVNRERQEGPHAHEVVLSADNRLAYVPDLGLDQIRIYRMEPAQGKLLPNDPPFVKQEPGLGPRHMAFSPDGKYAYVVNELKSFVTVFSHNPSDGTLRFVQTVSTVPEGFTGENGPAEILIDRAGKFVYASNRGPGTIAVFAVNPSDGTLRQVQIAATGGTFPRGVELDPTGEYLFAGDQKADQFVLFRVDPNSGQLTLTGKVFNVPSPVSFAFVPLK